MLEETVNNFNQEYLKICKFPYPGIIMIPDQEVVWVDVIWISLGNSFGHHVQIITMINQLNYILESFTSPGMFQRGKDAMLTLFSLNRDHKFLE